MSAQARWLEPSAADDEAPPASSRLPLALPRKAPAGPDAEPDVEARVLIVDDDDEAREASARALREAGLVVVEASNGLDALRAFESARPQIALLEVMTPFVDGYSTCRAMRDLPGGETAAIIMMTDVDDIESLRFGYDAGATDFITKPVNPIILQHRMRYMLRAAEAMDGLRTSQRKLAHLADHDALTGLPNRRSLESYMRRLTEESGAKAGAVYLLDLDGFKRVNDTFGHAAGDDLICQVGRRLVEGLGIPRSRTRDAAAGQPLGRILARLGGDEFVFIDPTVASEEEAAPLGDRILALVAAGFDIAGHHVSVTTSIGVALVANLGPAIEPLLQCADAAMYQAKAKDRNNACFYSQVMSERARARLDIENALRSPRLFSQLEVFYQPKVDLVTSTVVGAEALLRWRHPERGLISPAEFIPVAEETGLIVGIGRWVLRQSCRQLRAWRAIPELRSMRLAVNVSARQFRDPRFRDDVKEIVSSEGIDPRALELEITEGTLMNDTKMARDLLRELKALGIWVALDDFGTGYSALGYLRQFPFDTLKIDRSFVSDILVDPDCAAITGAVVALANRLNLRVVAEGIETHGQVECLRDLGCDQGQGYLYSRPVPIAEFEAWALGRVTKDSLRPPRPFAARSSSGASRASAIPPIR